MKQYLKLIKQSDENTYNLTRKAGKMTQREFSRLLNKQRTIVKKIWGIRESGKITFN